MDLNLKRTLLVLFILTVEFGFLSNANFVFPVEHKFKRPHTNLSLNAIKAHDSLRHRRFLATVDIELAGNGLPSSTGLYYTKLGLGSPAKNFHVQVDTGSDIMWVDLAFYDLKDSKTSAVVPCDGDFCSASHGGQVSDCEKDKPCPYVITYGDGGQTSGSFVKDLLTFNRAEGNLRTGPDNSSVIFGLSTIDPHSGSNPFVDSMHGRCGSKQSGTLSESSDESLDGIIGFGQANSSVLSQLAAAGKAKKVFSHCLDNIRGGGIFSIGQVVEPKFNTTPLVPRILLDCSATEMKSLILVEDKKAHYNIILKDLEVDGDFLKLPLDIFDTGNGRRTIIDSGTTLVYLPPNIYDQLMDKVLRWQPRLQIFIIEKQYRCFRFWSNFDASFPVVKFHFERLSLIAYPSDYMFHYNEDIYCIGWQKSVSENKNAKDLILLGDLLLSNKVVVYDLEKMEIGWKDYNCSSSIKVKDEKTGSVYTVGSHNLSPSASSTVVIGGMLPIFLLLIAMITV
ncbi:hypothetical protein RIF29_38023 [Crotalaria pallida]|uniref:Peptidase A1 domain-containing protein n=1 Tax=Crotalaria pallida TaxID=3830 RepID=A0AAN9E4U8_CROPI